LEFHGALRQTLRKWKPAIAQLEFTQMALYAPDCTAARTTLVEHDVTIDLYRQLLANGEDWDVRRQYDRWLRFEPEAWRTVDCVVTMSEKDRTSVAGGRSVEVIPNGVDIERFQPRATEPERTKLLFIGAFQHLPNLLATEFFLDEVWPRLREFD